MGLNCWGLAHSSVFLQHTEPYPHLHTDVDRHTHTDLYSNSYTDGYSHQHTYSHTNPHFKSCSDGHARQYARQYPDPYFDSHSDEHAHQHAHGHTERHLNTCTHVLAHQDACANPDFTSSHRPVGRRTVGVVRLIPRTTNRQKPPRADTEVEGGQLRILPLVCGSCLSFSALPPEPVSNPRRHAPVGEEG
jgi:hypothetical protein